VPEPCAIGAEGVRVTSSSFKRHFATTTATNLAMMAVGVATGTLSARLLGPQGRGELAAITAFPAMVSALALIGAPSALLYYVARFPERSAAYLAASGVVAMCGVVPAFIGAYLYIPVLLAHQRPGVVWAARIFLLQMAVYLFASSPGEMLRSVGRFGQWNALRAVPRLLVLGAFLFAWAASIRRPEFFALASLVASGAMVFPLWTWLTPVLIGSPRPTWAECAEITRYALPSVLGQLPRNLNLNLDQVVMSAALPARALGLYAAAVAWSGASVPILQAIGFALFPRIASSHHAETRARVLARTVRLTTFIAVAMTLVILAATPVAVPALFGTGFTEAVKPATILVLAGLFSGINMVLGDGVQGLGEPATVFAAEALGLVVTATSLAALIPRLQITGAAIASLLSYASVTAFLVYRTCALARLSIADLLMPRITELRLTWQAASHPIGSAAQRLLAAVRAN